MDKNIYDWSFVILTPEEKADIISKDPSLSYFMEEYLTDQEQFPSLSNSEPINNIAKPSENKEIPIRKSIIITSGQIEKIFDAYGLYRIYLTFSEIREKLFLIDRLEELGHVEINDIKRKIGYDQMYRRYFDLHQALNQLNNLDKLRELILSYRIKTNTDNKEREQLREEILEIIREMNLPLDTDLTQIEELSRNIIRSHDKDWIQNLSHKFTYHIRVTKDRIIPQSIQSYVCINVNKSLDFYLPFQKYDSYDLMNWSCDDFQKQFEVKNPKCEYLLYINHQKWGIVYFVLEPDIAGEILDNISVIGEMPDIKLWKIYSRPRNTKTTGELFNIHIDTYQTEMLCNWLQSKNECAPLTQIEFNSLPIILQQKFTITDTDTNRFIVEYLFDQLVTRSHVQISKIIIENHDNFFYFIYDVSKNDCNLDTQIILNIEKNNEEDEENDLFDSIYYSYKVFEEYHNGMMLVFDTAVGKYLSLDRFYNWVVSILNSKI